MKTTTFSFATLTLMLAARGVLGMMYSQTDSHQGIGFLKSFSHQAIPDPTHGRVNYVDQATALKNNLTFAESDTFIIRADHTTKLSASGPGRMSVRIQSNKKYLNHVAVFNIRHMPEGCGTWPAVWEVGADWPNQGEVDILEGVNDQSPNQATLHTAAGCTMSKNRMMIGNAASTNCDALVDGNAGCGVRAPSTNSFGPAFNLAGGGWYAMERTPELINVWFWSRQDANVPTDVHNGEKSIDTGKWGTPFATFPATESCDLTSFFGWHNIVINLTLCGDWAGNVFGGDGCPGSCTDFVNNNPSAFENAYFDFQWLKIYG